MNLSRKGPDLKMNPVQSHELTLAFSQPKFTTPLRSLPSRSIDCLCLVVTSRHGSSSLLHHGIFDLEAILFGGAGELMLIHGFRLFSDWATSFLVL